jgi:hypothetical protein
MRWGFDIIDIELCYLGAVLAGSPPFSLGLDDHAPQLRRLAADLVRGHGAGLIISFLETFVTLEPELLK